MFRCVPKLSYLSNALQKQVAVKEVLIKVKDALDVWYHTDVRTVAADAYNWRGNSAAKVYLTLQDGFSQ